VNEKNHNKHVKKTGRERNGIYMDAAKRASPLIKILRAKG
jgi:hypothetical protein